MKHASRFPKYWLLPLTVILMFGVLGSNCQTSSIGTMTGNDGKTYKTVKIGDQWWMAENLRETKYRDGSAIPEVTDDDQWAGLSTGARCSYDNNETHADTYGYLYNWYAVTDTRQIAPADWHVPTDAERNALTKYLGWDAGSKLADNATLWVAGDLKQNASFGESGFSALPGGCRNYNRGSFYSLGYASFFWSATEHDTGSAANLRLHCDYSDVGLTLYLLYSVMPGSVHNKRTGFSVRLVRD